ncbi:hypothetical protein NMY22_g3127 [Coprinellus aureogranulatus]|nr:hypothetical protein NMY22_g3127 [Coprinellus aureogranulatus]
MLQCLPFSCPPPQAFAVASSSSRVPCSDDSGGDSFSHPSPNPKRTSLALSNEDPPALQQWVCTECRFTREQIRRWGASFKRNRDGAGETAAPDATQLYPEKTSEKTRKFKRISGILCAYRVALARYEQADGNQAFTPYEVQKRKRELRKAEGMLALVTEKVEELTPASRQLFSVFINELQRREVENAWERIVAYRAPRL